MPRAVHRLTSLGSETFSSLQACPQPPDVSSTRYVCIKKGDTLWDLARKHHIKGGYRRLFAINKENPFVKSPHLILTGGYLLLTPAVAKPALATVTVSPGESTDVTRTEPAVTTPRRQPSSIIPEKPTALIKMQKDPILTSWDESAGRIFPLHAFVGGQSLTWERRLTEIGRRVTKVAVGLPLIRVGVKFAGPRLLGADIRIGVPQFGVGISYEGGLSVYVRESAGSFRTKDFGDHWVNRLVTAAGNVFKSHPRIDFEEVILKTAEKIAQNRGVQTALRYLEEIYPHAKPAQLQTALGVINIKASDPSRAVVGVGGAQEFSILKSQIANYRDLVKKLGVEKAFEAFAAQNPQVPSSLLREIAFKARFGGGVFSLGEFAAMFGMAWLLDRLGQKFELQMNPAVYSVGVNGIPLTLVESAKAYLAGDFKDGIKTGLKRVGTRVKSAGAGLLGAIGGQMTTSHLLDKIEENADPQSFLRYLSEPHSWGRLGTEIGGAIAGRAVQQKVISPMLSGIKTILQKAPIQVMPGAVGTGIRTAVKRLGVGAIAVSGADMVFDKLVIDSEAERILNARVADRVYENEVYTLDKWDFLVVPLAVKGLRAGCRALAGSSMDWAIAKGNPQVREQIIRDDQLKL